MRAVEHQSRETELLLRLNLASLLLLLNVQSKRFDRHGFNSDAKERIERFLAENVRNEPNWRVLAKELGISPSYLLKNFRKFVGCSPMQAVQRARLKEAARLLRETTLSLEEVQRCSGMTSFSMFYRLFVLEYGISPGKYRKKRSRFPEK